MLDLGTLKTYALAALTAIIGFLTIRNKFLSSKNDKLERDALINDEIKVIHEQQEADETEVLNNEQREIEKEIESLDPISKRDRFGKL